jgi:putative membrane protein
MKLIHNLVVALKGFFMGAANVVPGVSGGTIALITGIYKEIIEALNSLMEKETWQALFHGDFKRFWKQVHGTFLLWLAIGVVLSVFSLAKLMTYVLEHHPVQTWAFFFGLIVASAILMFKDIKGWGIKEILFTLGGVALGLLVCTLSPTQTPDNAFFIFLCGAIAVCTMILPGISGSFILVIMGKYDYIMQAVADLNWSVLIIFALGCVVGILAFAKFLHWLLGRFEKQTMLVLLGFILGSLVKVWPWANESVKALPDPHYGAAALWCVLGILLVLGVEGFATRSGARQSD